MNNISEILLNIIFGNMYPHHTALTNFLEKTITKTMKKKIAKKLNFYMLQEHKFPFLTLYMYTKKENKKFSAHVFVGVVKENTCAKST